MPRTMTALPETASDDLKAQLDYAEKKEQEGGDIELMVADAFVRGIRDIGYKSTGTALNELIDNSIRARPKRLDYRRRRSRPISGFA